MRIAELNMLSYGSTGKLMFQIAEEARKQGHEVYTFSPVNFHDVNLKENKKCFHQYYGSVMESKINNLLGRILGCDGCLSIFSTYTLIEKLEKNKIELLHLHNLHGYRVNFPMLFSYVKKKNIKVIWTLHDCWTFTGHCPHFDLVKCEKWKKGCWKCPQYRSYPQSKLDNSKYMYKLKKKWFSNLTNMALVTPSIWLKKQVEESYLNQYPIWVINNGIDLNIFKPTASQIRREYNCEEKILILGVAFDWSNRKGIDIFEKLALKLPSKFQIILVGVSATLAKQLPSNIIVIEKTKNQKMLAQIYSAADVFVNPTREEVFGMVNIEALACGTPVITFNTGGSPECIDESCGRIVEKDDLNALEYEIVQLTTRKKISQEACRKQAEKFDKNIKFKEYVTLYQKMLISDYSV